MLFEEFYLLYLFVFLILNRRISGNHQEYFFSDFLLDGSTCCCSLLNMKVVIICRYCKFSE